MALSAITSRTSPKRRGAEEGALYSIHHRETELVRNAQASIAALKKKSESGRGAYYCTNAGSVLHRCCTSSAPVLHRRYHSQACNLRAATKVAGSCQFKKRVDMLHVSKILMLFFSKVLVH